MVAKVRYFFLGGLVIMYGFYLAGLGYFLYKESP